MSQQAANRRRWENAAKLPSPAPGMASPHELKIRAARQAVRVFYSYSLELSDSDEVTELREEILATSRRAVARGTPMTDEEWLALAEQVDEACVAEGQTRLFNGGR